MIFVFRRPKSLRLEAAAARINAAGLLATCGFEKMVKIWSAVPLPNSTGGLDAAAASLYKPEVRRPDPSALGRVYSRGPQYSTEEDRDVLDLIEIMVKDLVGRSKEPDDSSLNHSSTDEEDYLIDDMMVRIVGENDEDSDEQSISSSQYDDNDSSEESDSSEIPSSPAGHGEISNLDSIDYGRISGDPTN